MTYTIMGSQLSEEGSLHSLGCKQVQRICLVAAWTVETEGGLENGTQGGGQESKIEKYVLSPRMKMKSPMSE